MAVYVTEACLVVAHGCRNLPYYGSDDGSWEASGEEEESGCEDERVVVGLLGCKYRKGVDGVHIRPYREDCPAAEEND